MKPFVVFPEAFANSTNFLAATLLLAAAVALLAAIAAVVAARNMVMVHHDPVVVGNVISILRWFHPPVPLMLEYVRPPPLIITSP